MALRAVGGGRRLDTPGGGPSSISPTAALRAALGHGGLQPDGRSMDRSSLSFHREVVEYFLRRRMSWSDGWRVCEDEYEAGRLMDSRAFVLQEVRPARAYSTVSTVESMILGNRPRFFLEGFTAFEDEEIGPVLEDSLNNEWQRNFRLVRETRLCARDASKYGVGIMLTSYEDTGLPDPEEAADEAVEARDDHLEDPVAALASTIVETEIADAEAAAAPPEMATNFEGDSRVVRGRIVSRRISPWAFLIDPDCTCLEDARWVGRIVIADWATVKNDPLLKNTENLKPSAAIELDGKLRDLLQRSYLDGTVPYDLVVLYELFVRMEDGSWQMKLMAEAHDEFLREVDMPYWIGCPYADLRWNQTGEEFFPQSDIQIVLSEILAERILLTKVFDGYSREHVDTTFYDKKIGVNEEELYAVGNPSVGKYVGIEGLPTGSSSLGNHFYRPPKDAKSPEALNVLAMLERAMQVSSGMGPNQFGQALKSGTTATESAEVAQFARGRGQNKFSAMEEFLSTVAYQRLGLMAQFYDSTDIRRLVGREASEVWSTIDWTPGDVQQGLNVIVEPGSTRQESEETRVNQILTLIGIINQDPGIRALFDIPALYKELFRRMGFQEGSKFLLTQDGVAFGNQLAELDAARLAPGGGGAAAGGSPPAVPATGPTGLVGGGA